LKALDSAHAGLYSAVQSLPPSLRHDIRNAVVCVRNTSSLISSVEIWDSLSQDVRDELLAELKRATALLERTLLMANHTHDGDA
jgi:hypothetical protein